MANTLFARGTMFLVAGVLSLLFPIPARSAVQQLSLPQAIEYSLQNNGDLKSFREEKGIVDAGKVRAGLLPNPTLEFEADSGALTGSSAESSLTIAISQELLLAGKRSKRLAVAERAIDLYRYQLADKERLIREEVKTFFYAVMLAEQQLALADRSVALNRQLLDVSRERLTAGDIPELEMNLVKVELARSEASRIDVATALHQHQEKLSTSIALATGTQYALSGTLQTASTSARTLTKTLKSALAELKQLALAQRPDIKALEAETARGQAGVKLARAERIPDLTVGLALWRDTRSMNIGGLEGREKACTVGMKLSMPIPVFDQNQAGVQEARARLSSAESLLSAINRNVEREVEAAYINCLSSEKILSLYKADIIPQLEENLSLTGEAWRLGEVGIQTVIQEQKKFFEVSDNYLMALYNRQIALVKLDSAVATELNGGIQ